MHYYTHSWVQMIRLRRKVKPHRSEGSHLRGSVGQHVLSRISEQLSSTSSLLPLSLIFIGLWAIFSLFLQVWLWFKYMYDYKTRRDVSIHIWNDIVLYFHRVNTQCLLNLVCYELRIKTLKLPCIFTFQVFFSFWGLYSIKK